MSPASALLPNGTAFDALLADAHGNDPLNEDARQMDGVRIELAGLDEFLDLGNGDLASHGTERVEVAGALVEDKIAVRVALGCADQPEVADDALLEHVRTAAELPSLLCRRRHGHGTVRGVPPRQPTVGDLRTDAGRRVERGNTAPTGTEALGERALRY